MYRSRTAGKSVARRACGLQPEEFLSRPSKATKPRRVPRYRRNGYNIIIATAYILSSASMAGCREGTAPNPTGTMIQLSGSYKIQGTLTWSQQTTVTHSPGLISIHLGGVTTSSIPFAATLTVNRRDAGWDASLADFSCSVCPTLTWVLATQFTTVDDLPSLTFVSYGGADSLRVTGFQVRDSVTGEVTWKGRRNDERSTVQSERRGYFTARR